MQSSAKFYNTIYWLYPIINIALIYPRKRLIKLVNECPKGRLLEVGVGTGSYLNEYEQKVTAIDNAQKMLDLAKKNTSDTVSLVQMSGDDLKFENDSFDYVVLSFIIAVVDNPNELISEAHRVLKPDGKLFILNHFPPNNILKYLDRAFSKLSSLFMFNSNFELDKINALKNLTLAEKHSIGLLAYYQLLIFNKSVKAS